MATRVIALNGAAGSGKSEVARILVHEYGFEPVKFANPLKSMLRSFYEDAGLTDPHEVERRMEGDLKEEPCPYLLGKTPRHAMQTLGTEWGRDLIAPTLWVTAWASRVASIPGPVVVDDCRFVDEARCVNQANGQVWRIIRPDNPKAVSGHVSECSLHESLVDVVVFNKGTLDDLRMKIDALI